MPWGMRLSAILERIRDQVTAGNLLFGHQNSAEEGVLGNGMASLMLSMPVANCTSLSKPSPKPACGTENKETEKDEKSSL